MAQTYLGQTLVIANPSSHSGKGAAAADFVERFLHSFSRATQGFSVYRTKTMDDARRTACEASEYQTVIALGGDGIIHEVVNGLMAIPAHKRPVLGIIPMGTGNDYARTLAIVRNAPEAALGQLMQGPVKNIDLGCVNGEYFAETLSFGLDALVAADTTKRRKAGTTQQGTSLFVSSGFKFFSKRPPTWNCIAHIDEKTVELKTVIFVMQIGPTYGAGFKICPEALPHDGYFDLCYNTSVPNLPHLLSLFGLARVGAHTKSRIIQTERAQHVQLHFDEDVPVQADGEPLSGRDFDITILPSGLRVIPAASCSW